MENIYKKRQYLSTFLCGFFLFFVLCLIAYLGSPQRLFASQSAGITQLINFQGKLVNLDGTTVADGTHNMVFTLYDAASSGTTIWTETDSVTTSNGIFQILLGTCNVSCSPALNTIDFNKTPFYLGIAWNGDTEMTPRIQFAAVPEAINAQMVNGITLNGTDTNSYTIPSTNNGTFLTSNQPTQTVTSTQTTGALLAFSDSTTETAATTGLTVTLSGSGAFDQTGLQFNLSNASGSNLNDIVGSGSTWKISRAGALTVSSCTGCGGGGATLQTAYNTGNTLTTTSGNDIALTLASGLGTATKLSLTNNHVSNVTDFYLNNANASGTNTNGLLLEQTGAGTLTNGIQIKQTAGAITTGLLFTGSFTNFIDSPSNAFTVSNAGGVSSAAGYATRALSGATTNVGFSTSTITGGSANNLGMSIGAITAVAGANNIGINIAQITGVTSATSIGLNVQGFGAQAGTATYGLKVGPNSATATTNEGLDIGNISGAGSANTGISIGNLSGSGSTNTGISIGNLSGTGTTNYGIQLGTLTGGTTSNYQISTGTLTSATTTTNAQLNLGTIVTTGGTTNYGINIGALSGTGTTNYGENIATLTSVGTTNYGLNISGATGAATTNYGLYVGAVSGAASNYSAIFSSGNVGIGYTAPAAALSVAGNVLIGSGEAGTPSNVTIRGAAASGSNVAGGDIIHDASNGTGSGGSGNLIFRTAAPATTITLDSLSTKNSTSGSPVTWSHTISGSNRMLVVGVSGWTADASLVSTVTWTASGFGAQTLQKATEVVQGTAAISSLWYLVAPNAGTGTISVSLNNSSNAIVIGATSWNGVNQSTPVGTVAPASAVSGNPTVTLSSATGELVIDNLANFGGFTNTKGASQTTYYDLVQGNSHASGSTQPGAGSVTMSWTQSSSDRWALAAIPMKPIAGSNTDTLVERLRITPAGNVGIGTNAPAGLLDVSGNLSGTPGLTGPFASFSTQAFNDTGTAASGTANNMVFNSIAAPTISSSNTSVTTTNAYALYLAGGPTAGTNETITNSYALGVLGNSSFTNTGLTTATGVTFFGPGSSGGVTSGSGLAITGSGAALTFVHTATNDTGQALNISIRDSSTNGNNGGVTSGIAIASAVNTTGAGTKEIDGVNVNAPTFNQCVTGACTWNGMKIGATAPTSQITANGLNILGAAAVTSSTLNDILLGQIGTTGAGTQNGINIGQGYNNGLVLQASSAYTQAVAQTGIGLDFNTTFTPLAGANITGINILTPALTISSGSTTTTYTGYNIGTAGTLTTQSAGSQTINWNGGAFVMPTIVGNITGTAINSNGLKITTGNLTQVSGATVTQNGLLIDSTNTTITTGGTLFGLRINGPTTQPSVGTYNNLFLNTSTNATANAGDSATIGVGNLASTAQNNRTTLNVQNNGTGYFDLELLNGFVNNQGTNTFTDDFIGKALDTTSKWTAPVCGTGGTAAISTATVNEGVLFKSGTSSGTGCTLATQTTFTNGFIKAANNPVYEAGVQMASTANTQRAYFGFSAAALTGDANTSLHVTIEKRAADTVWQCAVGNGSAEQITSIGVNISTSAIQRLRIQVQTGTTPQVICSVGTTAVSVTTDAPASSTGIMDIFNRVESNGTSVSGHFLDYVRVWQDDPTDNGLGIVSGIDAAHISSAPTPNTPADGSVIQSPPVSLASLSVDGIATMSADLHVAGNGFFANALAILGTFTANNLIVQQVSQFIGSVTFTNSVNFLGRPTFNADTAGYAQIQPGADSVSVVFKSEYETPPLVSATLTTGAGNDLANSDASQSAVLSPSYSYLIVRTTTKGFTIRLNKPAESPVTFSWAAISIKNPNMTIGNSLYQSPLPTPTITQSNILQFVTVTQPPTVTPTSTPTPQAIIPTPTDSLPSPTVDTTPQASNSSQL